MGVKNVGGRGISLQQSGHRISSVCECLCLWVPCDWRHRSRNARCLLSSVINLTETISQNVMNSMCQSYLALKKKKMGFLEHTIVIYPLWIIYILFVCFYNEDSFHTQILNSQMDIYLLTVCYNSCFINLHFQPFFPVSYSMGITEAGKQINFFWPLTPRNFLLIIRYT